MKEGLTLSPLILGPHKERIEIAVVAKKQKQKNKPLYYSFHCARFV